MPEAKGMVILKLNTTFTHYQAKSHVILSVLDLRAESKPNQQLEKQSSPLVELL